MTMTCASCGAPLNEGQTFCTVCGKERTSASAAESEKKFCTGCGKPLAPGVKFCQKCGAAIKGDVGETSPATPATRPPSSGSSIVLKLVAIALALVMLFVILVMGTCGYVAYRARQKAHAIAEVYEEQASRKTSGGSARNRTSTPTAGGAATPASKPLPVADPVVPVAASGEQSKDWGLKYERTEGGPEADLVVRTGDINNLGYGWPQGFDPFSGNSTPPHPWPEPERVPAGAPDGTDRIMLGSAVIPGGGDGYSGTLHACVIGQVAGSGTVDAACRRARDLTVPAPIVLGVGSLPNKVDAVLVQIFADDFQPIPFHSHFQVTLNGTRIPSLEYAINSLDQTGPIGKLLSVQLLPEYWPLLQSGTVKLLIDDPTTHVADGYAVDFVRILVNPHNFKYQVSLTASVTDADTQKPIAAAAVTAALQSAATDAQGKCQMSGLPAGLVTATAAAPGYDENSVPVDLIAGQTGHTEIQLHRHEESTAALERAIAQSGSATIYGIHFDTDSAKLRSDSMPALNAVLGLIKNHPDTRWIISGHTDNQGSVEHNQTLSEQRAAAVVTWLKTHGLDSSRLDPQGFGATRPVADNATANGRALNRRVEIASEKPSL